MSFIYSSSDIDNITKKNRNELVLLNLGLFSAVQTFSCVLQPSVWTFILKACEHRPDFIILLMKNQFYDVFHGRRELVSRLINDKYYICCQFCLLMLKRSS